VNHSALDEEQSLMPSEDEEEKRILSQIPKPSPSYLTPKSVSKVLDRLIAERGYASQQSRQVLEEAWQTAVGEFLSSQSKVGNVRRGQLSVYATNDIVRSELEYQKSKALRSLQESLPEMKLTGIRIQLHKR
jgi:predicted nucleic acid-binding Zn ribbon protein